MTIHVQAKSIQGVWSTNTSAYGPVGVSVELSMLPIQLEHLVVDILAGHMPEHEACALIKRHFPEWFE
jgi:hypothetical protein